MDFDINFVIQMIVYAVGIGTLYGALNTKLRNLEKSVSKLSSLLERTCRVEESTKSAHHRLDDLRMEVKGIVN